MPTPLSEQFQHLLQVVSSSSFLKKEALGGEIGFFVSAYEPARQAEVEQATAQLKNRLSQQGIFVLELNLYDLCLDILHENSLWSALTDREPSMPRERLLRALRSSLGVEQRLVPAIERRLTEPYQVVFLTGIGQVFPYVRSHTVLNNLQRVLTQAPLVMFYPGLYDGRSLNLFGLLHDDNYYRAFNIANIPVK